MLIENFESGAQKERYVRSVFSAIAHRYDFMNTILSFNQDKYWRRFAADKTRLSSGEKGLDVCCGTGRLTLEMAKLVGQKGAVTGIDFCDEMLSVGRANIEKTPYSKIISFMRGNAVDLPFAAESFDAVTSAFALRNVPDLTLAIREMLRVAKPGGRVVTLDLAKPGAPVFKQLYYLYFEKVLPWLGQRGVNANNWPYYWLPESLRRFPHQAEVVEIFSGMGLENVSCNELTGGIVAVYSGVKAK